MGNIESANQRPYSKQRPEGYPKFPSEPPLQVKSVSELRNPVKNQNVMPYQTQPQQYQYVPPAPSQDYFINSQIKSQAPMLTESMVGNQRSSLTHSQGLPIQSIQRNIVSPINNSNKSQGRVEQSVIAQSKVDQSSDNQGEQLPLCKIKFVPEVDISILRKENQQKSSKKFKIGNRLLDIDQLKFQLRTMQKQVLMKLLPGFDNDIMKMNYAIEQQRQQKLKDKNKVLFLLMQRHHYIKVCTKFLEQNDKLKAILFEYRKKACLQDITEAEINAGQHIKLQLQKMIQNIESDLPQKGWTALIEQPDSKLYKGVVNSALCTQQIMSKYKELEQSLSNPDVYENLVNVEMMESKTRRIGETMEENKRVEGPREEQPMKSTKHPVA